jgi:hypothetical protein
LTFSFSWSGPASDYPGDALGHSGEGADERQDRVANDLKRCALEALSEFTHESVAINGYGSVEGDSVGGSTISLHISVLKPVEEASVASPPPPDAAAPEGTPEVGAPGTEATGGPGEATPDPGGATPSGSGPEGSSGPAQSEGEPGDSSRLGAASPEGEMPQD